MHDRYANITFRYYTPQEMYEYEYIPFQQCMERVDECHSYDELKLLWDSVEQNKYRYTNSHYEFAREHMVNRLELILDKYEEVIDQLFDEPL